MAQQVGQLRKWPTTPGGVGSAALRGARPAPGPTALRARAQARQGSRHLRYGAGNAWLFLKAAFKPRLPCYKLVSPEPEPPPPPTYLTGPRARAGGGGGGGGLPRRAVGRKTSAKGRRAARSLRACQAGRAERLRGEGGARRPLALRGLLGELEPDRPSPRHSRGRRRRAMDRGANPKGYGPRTFCAHSTRTASARGTRSPADPAWAISDLESFASPSSQEPFKGR